MTLSCISLQTVEPERSEPIENSTTKFGESAKNELNGPETPGELTAPRKGSVGTDGSGNSRPSGRAIEISIRGDGIISSRAVVKTSLLGFSMLGIRQKITRSVTGSLPWGMS